MSTYKEIYINGYKRKDGTWVSPHTRTVKVSGYGSQGSLFSYRTTNPLQLSMDFSGKTNTNIKKITL
jgi:hypothetical protein|tara:strand:- start:553 stop:753 length:201 start_codon:yes stop_codon:yes gene_type:complete